uniref:Uncharacterized protein n=1 Tax=Rhizophora mucronata TaxID=61149 RepID=A0A2P2JBY9_RHIMU
MLQGKINYCEKNQLCNLLMHAWAKSHCLFHIPQCTQADDQGILCFLVDVQFLENWKIWTCFCLGACLTVLDKRLCILS